MNDTTETALLLPTVIDGAKENALVFFATEKGLDPIIDEIKKRVKSEVLDISTEAGRKRIGSLARQIGSAKMDLKEVAEALTEDWRRKTKAVTSERLRMEKELDALRDEVKAPLDEFRAREEERTKAHEEAISVLAALSQVQWSDNNVEQIEAHLNSVNLLEDRDWQEFKARASVAILSATKNLSECLSARKKYDAEQAELSRLRAEQEERDRIERERLEAERIERLKQEAAEKAKREAEEKAAKEAAAAAEVAKAEQERVEREREAAEARAKKAEQDRLAAEEKAKADAAAAEAKRISDVEKARKAEQARQEALKAAQEAEIAKREADKAHKAKIHNAIKAALQEVVDGGISGEDPMKDIVIAIASGKIPHVKILY